MNSQFESARHTKIHAVKDELREEARTYATTGKIGQKLAIIIGRASPADIVARLLSRDKLPPSATRKIRDMSGLEKPPEKLQNQKQRQPEFPPDSREGKIIAWMSGGRKVHRRRQNRTLERAIKEIGENLLRRFFS